jgi:hypothetical protein
MFAEVSRSRYGEMAIEWWNQGLPKLPPFLLDNEPSCPHHLMVRAHAELVGKVPVQTPINIFVTDQA